MLLRFILLQIDSRYGVVVRYPGKGSPPAITINFSTINGIHVYEENEITKCVCLRLAQSNAGQRNLEFFVDRKDVDNLVTYIMGYGKLAGNQAIELREEKPTMSLNG